jgi:hypothetical protein
VNHELVPPYGKTRLKLIYKNVRNRRN